MDKKQFGSPDHLPEQTPSPSSAESSPGSTKPSAPEVVATNSGPPPSGLPSPSASSRSDHTLPDVVRGFFDVFLGSDGHAYLLPYGQSNPTVLRVGSKPADAFLRRCAHRRGRLIKTSELRDVSDTLLAHAELLRDIREVWVRVAPYAGGFELDLGDQNHVRVRVTPGRVEVVTAGSTALFWRPTTQQPLPPIPGAGELRLLRRYVNLHPTEQLLLEIWMVYTLSHPKLSSTIFVILLLLGPQGAGKSLLTRFIQALVDPSSVGVQLLPRNPRDLGIAAQQAHLVCYDNAREIPESMADNLCLTSTGGSINTRRLYTDSEQVTLQLRVAVLLNTIHPILDQADLAQRCLPLTLRPINSKDRRREKDLMAAFEIDRPAIFRGLLDRAAAILAELPNGEPAQPERMAEFSAWLSAAERLDGARPEAYELEYARVLTAGMRDALLENPLAAAVVSLLEGRDNGSWSGTPAELLDALEDCIPRRATYSPEWPRTPSALSKRFRSLEGALHRQGIQVAFGRGRERKISLILREDFDHE